MTKDLNTLSFDGLEDILEGIEKPGRYTGGEVGVKSKSLDVLEKDQYIVNTALAFPEIYEIGMSNLGLQILYKEINSRKDMNAERVFSPWLDLEEKLRKTSTKLFSLENRIFLDSFDLIGISAQHELLYSNILNIIDLAGLNINASERKGLFPLVCLGGSAMVNPLPMSRFLDFAVIGEAEGLILDVLGIIKRYKRYAIEKEHDHKTLKKDLIEELKDIEGIYVPGEFKYEYGKNGKIKHIDYSQKVKKAYFKDFSEKTTLEDPVIANIRPVHDRFVAEIMRGCPRGCRFCQAGYIYRPVRKKGLKGLLDSSIKGVLGTGYDEISFMSLSTTDYGGIEKLLEGFCENFSGSRRVSVSLPSLRVDDFSLRLAGLVQQGRKTGLTFAPEAGSQKMRDAIGKRIDEEVMLDCIRKAFLKGWDKIKLYFIIGFSFESSQDIEAIADLVFKIESIAKESLPKKSFRRFKLNISVNAFIPKPFTPFQWLPFDPGGSLSCNFDYLKERLPRRFVKLSWSDTKKSLLETVLSRGDDRICKVIEDAWRSGARFDNWSDIFDFKKYLDAFEKNKIAMGLYVREYDISEILPWDIIDIGVDKKVFKREFERAREIAKKAGIKR